MNIELVRRTEIPLGTRTAPDELGETRSYDWFGGNVGLIASQDGGFEEWDHYQLLMSKLDGWDEREDWTQQATRYAIIDLNGNPLTKSNRTPSDPFVFTVHVGKEHTFETWGDMKPFVRALIENINEICDKINEQIASQLRDRDTLMRTLIADIKNGK